MFVVFLCVLCSLDLQSSCIAIAFEIIKLTYLLTYSNRNNSVADCSISLKFGNVFYHVTADINQTFKVNGRNVNVTASRNVSAVKTL